MDDIFSDCMRDVPRSFIRETLKDALMPGTISFAGGLPNRDLFPAQQIRAASDKAFDTYGKDLFQYSPSEGLAELRDWIASRYKDKGLAISADNILITSGAQQGLDLLGKTLLNDGDGVVIEEPGYLGAIQAFAICGARFLPVPVSEEGIDYEALASAIKAHRPKLIYTVPNFQNPSGISYTEANRRAAAKVIKGTNTLLIEDDPYGDLRFSGEARTSFKALLPEQTVLLGSFSKVVVPGFRIGWLAAPDALMQKLIVAKQAADLHTNQFAQCVLFQYLCDNRIDEHIAIIVAAYGARKTAMTDAIRTHFPAQVTHTQPEGGMFLWARLPGDLAAMDLFTLAAKEKVIFVPGDPFYIGQSRVNTFRLNYSCSDLESISSGIQRLGGAIHALLKNKMLDKKKAGQASLETQYRLAQGDWQSLGAAARVVRDAVFIAEQGIDEALEHDERDALTDHVVLFADPIPVATGRIDRDGKIGRVAVLKSYRRRGFGHRVMKALEAQARQLGLAKVYVHAQSTVVPFYLGLGYRPLGKEMMEAGIPHRFMEKTFAS